MSIGFPVALIWGVSLMIVQEMMIPALTAVTTKRWRGVVSKELRLDFTYLGWHPSTEKSAVVVSIGDEEIAVLEPARNYEYLSYNVNPYNEGEQIAAETVAPYLCRLFAPIEKSV